MKNGLATKNLITSIITTVMLVYFMAKSPSPKIIFIPFLICSIATLGKSLARINNKKKWEVLFGKLFIIGFLIFLFGFLAAAVYSAVREKNFGMLIAGIPFLLTAIYLIRNKLLNKKKSDNGESGFRVAVVVSSFLVFITFLAGIVLFVLGVKDGNIGIVFCGVIFILGALIFVLAALSIKGCFENVKVDVLGLYAGGIKIVQCLKNKK